MTKIFLVIVISVSAQAEQLQYFDLFKTFDSLYNIDYKISYTIAKIESGFNPYAIGVLTDKHRGKKILKAIVKKNVRFTFDSFKDKLHISIKPNSYKEALDILKNLKELKIKNYDLGLMQINRQNIKSFAEEKALLKSPKYNINKGIKILRDCYDKTGRNPIKALECYNKGFDFKKYKYDYVKKFFVAYKKTFM